MKTQEKDKIRVKAEWKAGIYDFQGRRHEIMVITKYDRTKKENLQGFGIRKNLRFFETDGKWQIWFYGWLIVI